MLLDTSDLGWDEVTESNYKAYKHRGPTGEGGRQGAVPTHLTWHTLQDASDRLGGCWKPESSILVGFTHLKSLIDEHGYDVGVERYNGVGRVEYSQSVREKASRWHDILGDAGGDDGEPPEEDPEAEEAHPEVHFGDSGRRKRPTATTSRPKRSRRSTRRRRRTAASTTSAESSRRGRSWIGWGSSRKKARSRGRPAQGQG